VEDEARRIRYRDRARKQPGIFRVRRQEAFFARQLRKIAGHVGEIIKAWSLDNGGGLDPRAVPRLEAQLAKYAEVVRPWARATAGRMLAEVAARDRQTWAEHAGEMSAALKRELRDAPTGTFLRARLEEQVTEITSIPTDAARRVQELTIKGLEDSKRASTYLDDIMRSGDVAKGRANMLARTMVSTTASGLVEARAVHAGSEGYIFETSKDVEVRPSHRVMQGKFILWAQPPTIEGYTAHAGCFANCRCWPRPVWPSFD
jgi:uncharacterized protein with gpF-like domain